MLRELAEELVRALKARGLTISAAESLTGGRIAAAITSVPGSSAVFPGGIVSYGSEVKHRVLGVSEKVLSECGAVSEPAARQMALGAAALLRTDLALSATGIAGPDGDGSGTPVGTVWLGLFFRGDCVCGRHLFSGGRAEVQEQAAAAALQMALGRLLEEEENSHSVH